MKKRRILTAIIACALTLCSSSLSPVSAAERFDHVNPQLNMSEEYYQQIEYCNEYGELVPEEVTKKAASFLVDSLKQLWLIPGYSSTNSSVYIEYAIPDGMGIRLNADTEMTDAIILELTGSLGYPAELSKIESETAAFYIELPGDDHELNYRIFEKALSILGEKYEVLSSYAQLNRVQFGQAHIYWQSFLPAYESTFDAQYGKIAPEINRALSENGFDIELSTEKGYMIFPNDITFAQQVDYGYFMKENFGLSVNRMYLCTPSPEFKASVDFLTVGNNYSDGDANEDGEMDIADSVLIMQSIANPDKYTLSPQGRFNADIADTGGGITNSDALAIQQRLLSNNELSG